MKEMPQAAPGHNPLLGRLYTTVSSAPRMPIVQMVCRQLPAKRAEQQEVKAVASLQSESKMAPGRPKSARTPTTLSPRPPSAAPQPHRVERPSVALLLQLDQLRTCGTVLSVDSVDDPQSPFFFIYRAMRQAESSDEPPEEQFIYLSVRPQIQGLAAFYFDPYHLQVVQHTQQPTYMMSIRGLTFAQDAEFIPTEHWVKSYCRFRRCFSLQFFVQYRRWKLFIAWNRCLHETKMENAKAELRNNLFLVNPLLQSPMLMIRKLCAEAEEECGKLLLYSSEKGVLSLEEFVAIQRAHQSKSAKRLKTQRNQMIEILINACGEVDHQRTLHEQELLSTAVDDTFSSSFTHGARKRQLWRRLIRFVKMCDCINLRALVALTLCSMKALADHFELSRTFQRQSISQRSFRQRLSHAGSVRMPHPPPTQPGAPPFAIRTALVMNDEGELTFEPSKEAIERAIDSVVHEMLDIVYSLDPFIVAEGFKAYIAGTDLDPDSGDKNVTQSQGRRPTSAPSAAASGSNLVGSIVATIVSGHDLYKESLRRIRGAVQSSFSHARRLADGYRRYVALYKENELITADSIRTQNPSADWYREHFDSFRDQLNEIDAMELSHDVGLLSVRCEALQQTILPSPSRCLSLLSMFLPLAAHSLNTSLLGDLCVIVNKLRHEPESVRDFSSFVEQYSTTVNRLPLLENQYDTVRDLYLLMDIEPSVEVPADDLMAWNQGTVRQFTALQDLLNDYEEHRDQQVRCFGAEITTVLEEVAQKAAVQQKKAAAPIFDDDECPPKNAIAALELLADELHKLENIEEEYTFYQAQFGLDVTHVQELAEASKYVTEKLKLWVGVRDWKEFMEELWATPVVRLDPDYTRKSVETYAKLVIRSSRALGEAPMLKQLKFEVDDLTKNLPVIETLRNPALQHSHWSRIDELYCSCKVPQLTLAAQKLYRISGDESLTFGELHQINFVSVVEQLLGINVAATQEAVLEKELRDIQKVWHGGGDTRAMEFVTAPYKQQRDMCVIGSNVDDITAAIEETLIRVSAMMTSRFCEGSLKARASKMHDEIVLIRRTLHAWLTFQGSWMYIESIFSLPEIVVQWSSDEKVFRVVDVQFRELMKRVSSAPNVSYITASSRALLEQFENGNHQLDKILASVERKLEIKRRLFPRFYFLSNDDLLDVLAQVRTPDRIQPHLLKIFDNIHRLHMSTSNEIQEMESSEGEVIRLPRGLRAKGEVEKWLAGVEAKMIEVLKEKAEFCVSRRAVEEKSKWIYEHPAQLVLAADQVMFAQSVTEALTPPVETETEQVPQTPRMGLQKVLDECRSSLGMLAEETGKELAPIWRSVVGTLITLEVHMRDITSELISEHVSSTSDFTWTKQLRAYWPTDTRVLTFQQNDFTVTYGHEYLGAVGRLVITPVTDRIVMTITGALRYCLGAAPAGPAGTGKTETVKDAAKTFARQCIVYNCSEGVTFRMMERLLAGLVQCGCWCCLDEFNRINIEVLSVIAAQLMEIQSTMRRGVAKFSFQGSEDMPLIPTYGAFITMNPTYAGRTELPDNLKSLFRPVAVMIPDYGMIAEVVLFSEGFQTAEVLSRKATQLYKLSSEQLSKQYHYDFGMRALKSVLIVAGAMKRSRPNENEDLLLIRASFDSNLPKLVAEDVPLFEAIVSDLFPSIALPTIENPIVHDAAASVLVSEGLQAHNPQIRKLVQFYDTLCVRFGVMLLGTSGTGKTVIRSTLIKALTALPQHSCQLAARTVSHAINPKAVTYAELFGSMNPVSQEWADGVLVRIVKDLVREIQQAQQKRGAPDAATTSVLETQNWIVFDGPVDTVWVESMNSVLDDSRLLCLENGVRIKIPQGFRFVFEVEDLSVASPATVSRCGMVYLDVADIDTECVICSWLQGSWAASTLPAEVLSHLEILLSTHVQRALEFCNTTQVTQGMLVRSLPIQMVTGMLHLLQATFCGIPEATKEGPLQMMMDITSNIFAFSYIWSFGANTSALGLELFDTFCRNELENDTVFPNFGLVHDFYIHPKTLRWSRWDDITPAFEFSLQKSFFDLIVPTSETTRVSAVSSTLMQQRVPVLLTGESGVGKTLIVNGILSSLHKISYSSPCVVQFSAKTTAANAQALIESKLATKGGRKDHLCSPSPNEKVCFFIDDINMPAAEQYGACPPLELLRQLLSSGGVYDRSKLFFKKISDVVFTAACGPPEGRTTMTKRLTRLFFVIQKSLLSEDTMRKVFGAILGGFFNSTFDKNAGGARDAGLAQFPSDVRHMARGMVTAATELFLAIKSELLPIPTKPQYTFNMRDLSKVIQGIMQVTPKTCYTSRLASSLWLHEVQRCFEDRLVDEQDRETFRQLAFESMRRAGLAIGIGSSPEEVFRREVVWMDFAKIGAQPQYDIVLDTSLLPKIIEAFQNEYNTGQNLVFFGTCCRHVCRIVRILRQPKGNALLVGVNGCGKRSVAKLSAAIVRYKVFTVDVGRSHSTHAFRDSLAEMCTTAGCDAKQIVFILDDSEIVDDGMLEDTCNMLNTGDVPNLFSQDDKDKIVNALLETAKQRNITQRHEIYRMFLNTICNNFHTVLCMSPIGDAFRARCRQFPSLTNCCTVDWFEIWPQSALAAVADRVLGDEISMNSREAATLCGCSSQLHETILDIAEQFSRETGRNYYVTPGNFLDFLRMYITLIKQHRTKLEAERGRMEIGSQRMQETYEQVQQMNARISEMEPQLREKKAKVEELQQDLTTRAKTAKEVAAVVEGQRAVARDEERIASALKLEAQHDLDEALPEVEAALDALKALQKQDIDEIKKYSNPTRAVSQTVEAVLTLLRERKPGEWAVARQVLGNPKFIDRLMTLDVNELDDGTIQKMQKFVHDPEYTPEKVGTAGSEACRSLCMWTRAMEHYFHVNRKVAPKRAALQKAEATAKQALDTLKETEMKLSLANSQVKALQETLQKATDELHKLEEKLDECRRRLHAATLLTSSLHDESARWNLAIRAFDSQLRDLPGTMLLAAASIAYLGPFSLIYRSETVRKWLDAVTNASLLMNDAEFSLTAALGDPLSLRNWALQNLPNDTSSIENAIIISHSCEPNGGRWPLIIDPQSQAQRWVKNMEGGNGLKILHVSDARLLLHLRQSITHGVPVLLQGIGDTLDSSLDSILTRNIYTLQGRKLIDFCGDTLDYSNGFRLYLVSSLENPRFLPDVSTRVRVLNFTATFEAVEEQVLTDVVAVEKQSLEEQRLSNVRAIAESKKQLRDIEVRVLSLINENKGNILDNNTLIDSLKKSQDLASSLQTKVQQLEEQTAELLQQRDVFKPVARRVAVLYFTIVDVARVCAMIQCGLDFVKSLYLGVLRSCAESKSSQSTAGYLLHVCKEVTEEIISTVARGLFHDEKRLFLFLCAANILKSSSKLPEAEWSLFLFGDTETAESSKRQWAFYPTDFAESVWRGLMRLEEVSESCHGLVDLVVGNVDRWSAWARDTRTLELPTSLSPDIEELQKRMTPFQQLLLVRLMCVEKLALGSYQFASSVFGQYFVERSLMPVKLEDFCRSASCPATPVLFILSRGTDLVESFLRCAAAMGHSSIPAVSLGQGQEEKAMQSVAQGMKEGSWVLLQNCHLSRASMSDLEKQVVALSASCTSADPKSPNYVHPKFVLWLTSEPCSFFPSSVLQSCLKLACDPPRGIRSHLVKVLAEMDPEVFQRFPPDAALADGSSKALKHRRLIFGLCFMHAVLQERKKFGPLGWNERYDFNDSDLNLSMNQIAQCLDSSAEASRVGVPWGALYYIVGEINYGGRVTDPWDRITLLAVVRQFLSAQAVDGTSFAEDYKIPPTYLATPAEYREFVGRNIPLEDTAEVFGMKESAVLRSHMVTSVKLLNQAIDAQPRRIGAQKMSTFGPQCEGLLKKAEGLLHQLPSLFDIEAAHPSVLNAARSAVPEPLATHLLHEVLRYNELLQTIRSGVKEFVRAMKGKVVMSASVDNVLGSFSANRVPDSWAAVGYISNRPLASWWSDLLERVSFMRSWLKNGEPAAFWLGSFFDGHGFLTSLLQAHGRKLKASVDTISFAFEVLRDCSAEEMHKPEDGAIVYGLYCEEFQWDYIECVMGDVVHSAGSLLPKLPPLHFLPEKDHDIPSDCFLVPLYNTTDRSGTLSSLGVSTNFLVAVELRTQKPQEYWIRCGAALVTMLPE